MTFHEPLRVIFAGGGTGGHLSPALAIAQTLRRKYPEAAILFIGAADRLEATKVPEAGFDFRAISVHGLAGRWDLRGLLKRLRGVLEIATGTPVLQSLAIMSRFQPDVVVGTGGYVCGPVLLAARLSRRPAILVEQNEEIGVTSRLAARLVRLAAVISEESGAYFRARGVRTEVVGNPVRPAVLTATRPEGIATLGLETDRLTVSFLGGSLGSSPLNTAAAGALRNLARESWFRNGWQVVHLTGPQRGGGLTPEEVRELDITYLAFPFRDDVHQVLAASDVVVTRAGGTFLAEIAARGLPMIIVPWSGAANDHQTRNARPFADAGAAVVIPDNELSAERLTTVLNDVLPDPAKRTAMASACRRLGRPDSAERIVGFLEELAARRAFHPGDMPHA
ncbi:MAG: UDP-N-acetylglucosamine--N-acetylmuramyl-(pentapeptide) pyrophosphoryl-undecaprenol N-acetylglucosamine transferase [Armatimonadota bacterium]